MAPPRDFDETTGWESGSWPKESLVDLSTDAFLLAFHIRGGNDPGHPDDLRKNILLLLKDLDNQGQKHHHAEEDLQAVRYTLCALLDETILNSRWEFKGQWEARTLQGELFGDHNAGERFFDLLERVHRKGSAKLGLLEVLCTALILGFEGKYKTRPGERLDLIRCIVDEIRDYRGGAPQGLSPHWRAPDETLEPQAEGLPLWAWVAPVLLALIIVVVYIFLRSQLDSATSFIMSVGRVL
jgi:type VI secretion system protein ImpK